MHENTPKAETMTASSNSPTPSENTDPGVRKSFFIEAGENWCIQKPTFAKTRIKEELILGLIKEAEARKSTYLDLSRKELIKIPEQLIRLNYLERLSLEGNEICDLPETMFDHLSNLVWLDLRNNILQHLPSIYIGRHKHLRNLLLQGNQLRTLPLELGFVKTLNGLNICDNPLDFPPLEVIAKGTHEVLRFLREVLLAKSEERTKLMLQQKNDGDLQHPPSRETTAPNSPLQPDELASSGDYNSEYPPNLFFSGSNTNGGLTTSPEAVKSSPQIPYTDTSETTTNNRRSLSSLKQAKQTSTNDTPLSPSQYMSFKREETQQAARHRDYKIKENAILQRRRDEEMLKQWREEAKILQQKKSEELRRNRREGSGRVSSPCVKKAPFGTDLDYLRVMSNGERSKEDVRQKHERNHNQRLRHEDALISSDEQINKIHELERKIKSHTRKMYERRNDPRTNTRDELEVAKRDLEICLQIDSTLQGLKNTKID